MKDDGLSTFLLLSVDLDKKRIEPHKSALNQYVGDIWESYSIESKNYKDEIKELLKTLVEHQLVSL